MSERRRGRPAFSLTSGPEASRHWLRTFRDHSEGRPNNNAEALGSNLGALIWANDQSGFESPVRAVVKDSATFDKLWTQAVSHGWGTSKPVIDFRHEMVILVAMGEEAEFNAIGIDSVVSWPHTLAVYDHLYTATVCSGAAEDVFPADMVKVPRDDDRVVDFRESRVLERCTHSR